MPKGGARPGAGRPKGSGRKLSTLAPPALPSPASYRRNSTEPLTELTGIEYLKRLVNDPSADVIRRDRAAGLLVRIEFRSGKIPIGKKAQLAEGARQAGWGSEWHRLLHLSEPEHQHLRVAAAWPS